MAGGQVDYRPDVDEGDVAAHLGGLGEAAQELVVKRPHQRRQVEPATLRQRGKRRPPALSARLGPDGLLRAVASPGEAMALAERLPGPADRGEAAVDPTETQGRQGRDAHEPAVAQDREPATTRDGAPG